MSVNITPLDIRKQTFKRVFRGYDDEEVQAFLEVLAEEFERLNRETIVLREKQSSLQTEVEHFRAMEQTLQEMLRTAQQAAEEVKENGRKEARLIVKESEIRGNRAIEKARAHVHTIRAEIVDLKNQRDMFVSKFQALVQAQGDFLGQLQFTDPDVVQEALPSSEGLEESEDTQA
ncbi:MAG: cell division initiation protein [Candidatus Latescibacterota bacterium]|jgi:cell division initiation protein